MPVSLRCLHQYERFRGDADGWVRSSEGRAEPALADAWWAIGEVVMNLRLAASVPVTDDFRRRVEAAAAALTGGAPELERELRRIADASAHW